MIKKLFLILSFYSLQAMEKNSESDQLQKWIIQYNKTNIHLTTDLFEACDKAAIIVVGKNEQNALHACPTERYEIIGCLYHSSINEIYKNKDTKKVIHNRALLKIVEPSLMSLTFQNKNKKKKKTLTYTVTRSVCSSYHEGKKAVTEAVSKDLARCYKNNLEFCLQNYESLLSKSISDTDEYWKISQKPHSIAFSSLSTKSGFSFNKAAPVAITSVLDFINKNSQDAFHDIYLVVDDIPQFNLYKFLLLKRTGLLYKMCLFYWGYKDEKSILAGLPIELRNYIVKLLI